MTICPMNSAYALSPLEWRCLMAVASASEESIQKRAISSRFTISTQ